MPFTFSHPAAILPLVAWPAARRRLSFSALAIGSIAPDFPYFVPPYSFAQFGHSPTGTLWFCVPVGAMALVFFHRFLQRPLMALAPLYIQERLSAQPEKKGVFWIAFSLWLGALSHIALDAFTHGNGAMVAHLPFLRELISTPMGALPLFKILQYGGSLAGILVLCGAMNSPIKAEYSSSAAP